MERDLDQRNKDAGIRAQEAGFAAGGGLARGPRDSLRAPFDEWASTVGNTGELILTVAIAGVSHRVVVKSEWENPTGSMKDRTALGLLSGALQRGQLGMGLRIIESTSGNLGIALAHATTHMGIGLVLVTDPRFPSCKRERLYGYDVEIDEVVTHDEYGSYLPARRSRVIERLLSDNRLIWLNQYENDHNPTIHHDTTAKELLGSPTVEKIDRVYVPVSTGGTYAGIRKRFRAVSPLTKVIGVDVLGSRAFGGDPGSRRFVGIGSARRSSYITENSELGPYYHELVSEEKSVAVANWLVGQGIRPFGMSTAVAIAACIGHIRRASGPQSIYCIGADSGYDYLETLYDERWLSIMGFDFKKLQAELRRTAHDESWGVRAVTEKMSDAAC